MLQIPFWHYVVSLEGLPVNIGGETCSVERFEFQLKLIKAKYRVVPLEEIVALIKEKKEPSSNVMGLTFDDGTKDHYQVVLPLLKKWGLTATFFVMTAPLKRTIPPTFKLQLIFGEVGSDTVRKNYFPAAMRDNNLGHLIQNIEVPPQRYRFSPQAMREVKWVCNYQLSPDEQQRVVGQMFRCFFDGKEKRIAEKMFLSPREILEIHQAGMGIGSHGVNHYFSGILTGRDFKEEFAGSKKVLEDLLGCEVPYYCYALVEPAGKKKEQTRKALKQAGYRAALGDVPGLKAVGKAPYDLFSIPRVHERDLFA